MGLVAVAEMGDKTQLLALVLATRFRRPLAIVAGILVATVGNHLVAAFVGVEAASVLSAAWLRWGLVASFVAMGVWTLIPDVVDEEEEVHHSSSSAFLVSLVSFFLAEIGDKTQLATVALGARFQTVPLVTAGTTLGMLLADVPAVILGERLTRRIPARTMRQIAAMLFVVTAIVMAVSP